jgi:Mlc titration factor MtfA (ptsG expression regulator)
MLFSWFKDLRRQSLLDEPFPDAWVEFLRRDVPHYEFLSPDEQKLLRDHIRVFIAEKNWEGCGGLEMTEEIQVGIAAQACLLLLGLENHDFYPNVETILVYPYGYKATDEQVIAAAWCRRASASGSARRGGRGPVVLSWSDALNGGRNPHDGHNVVLHEFAHKLDMRNGDGANGVPPLPEGQEQYDEWAEVMSAEYDQLVAQQESGRADLLDDYGATSPA